MMLGPLTLQKLVPMTVNMVTPPANVATTGGGRARMKFGGTDSYSR